MAIEMDGTPYFNESSELTNDEVAALVTSKKPNIGWRDKIKKMLDQWSCKATLLQLVAKHDKDSVKIVWDSTTTVVVIKRKHSKKKLEEVAKVLVGKHDPEIPHLSITFCFSETIGAYGVSPSSVENSLGDRDRVIVPVPLHLIDNLFIDRINKRVKLLGGGSRFRMIVASPEFLRTVKKNARGEINPENY